MFSGVGFAYLLLATGTAVALTEFPVASVTGRANTVALRFDGMIQAEMQ
jgi:hypothetical protein